MDEKETPKTITKRPALWCKINVVSIYTRIWPVHWLLNAKQGFHCPWTAAFSGKQTGMRGLGRRSEESHVPLQNQLLQSTANAAFSDQLPSHTRVRAHKCEAVKYIFMCNRKHHNTCGIKVLRYTDVLSRWWFHFCKSVISVYTDECKEM